MRTIQRLAVMTAAAVMTVLPLAPASAAASGVTTYHGTWLTGTNEACGTSPASGPWSVVMKHDGTASVSSTALLDGRLHAAWGGLVFSVVEWQGDSFTLSLGNTTLVLQNDTVTFTVPDRYTCGDGKLTGILTH